MELGELIISVGFFCAFLYLPLQIAATLVSHGRLRWASLAPVPVAAVIGIITAVGLAQGSNLWPLVMLFASPPLAAYLAVCFVAGAVARMNADRANAQLASR